MISKDKWKVTFFADLPSTLQVKSYIWRKLLIRTSRKAEEKTLEVFLVFLYSKWSWGYDRQNF